MSEAWKPVVGFDEYYEVSDLGRVRSLERMARINSATPERKRKMGGIIRKQCTSRDGHKYLPLTAEGVRKTVAVHRLVLEAFVGLCPEGMECCHNNGDPSDNRLENLRWDTHHNNNQDRKAHGNYATGEDHHMAKLTNKQIVEIRRSQLTGKELKTIYGVGESQISRIRRGESCGDIT